MRSSTIVNIALALISPLVFFIIAEVICRVFELDKDTQNPNAQIQLEMPTWLFAEENTARRVTSLISNPKDVEWIKIFEEGDGFRVRLIPGLESDVYNTFSQLVLDRKTKHRIKANSLGFRGQEFKKRKPANAFRILVFGDSSSFGWGVENEYVYHSVLKDLLQKKWPEKQVEVYSFAIPGDSSEYGKLIFDRFVEGYSPDAVILSFGANDAKLVGTPHRPQVQAFRKSIFLHRLRFLASKSALYRTLERILSSKNGKKKSAPSAKTPGVPLDEYVENLQGMLDEIAQLGAKPIVLNICTPGQYAVAAQAMAEKEKAVFVDAQHFLLTNLDEIVAGKYYPELVQNIEKKYPNETKQQTIYYISWDGCHPNVLGHKLIADQLVTVF